MKYIRQFAIIIAISFLGEILKYFLPFPIPASIYGMVLMFASLEMGLIKLEAVRETGHFLLEMMPLFFIPAGVGLLDSWDRLQPVLMKVAVIVVVSTVIVMGVSAKVTQEVMRRNRRKKDE